MAARDTLCLGVLCRDVSSPSSAPQGGSYALLGVFLVGDPITSGCAQLFAVRGQLMTVTPIVSSYPRKPGAL